MPSDKKRINLTIPDELYVRLQAYKNEQGISSDASACLQLIVQQLNGLEQSKAMLRLINNCSVEQLNKLSMEGLTLTKSVLERSRKGAVAPREETREQLAAQPQSGSREQPGKRYGGAATLTRCKRRFQPRDTVRCLPVSADAALERLTLPLRAPRHRRSRCACQRYSITLWQLRDLCNH